MGTLSTFDVAGARFLGANHYRDRRNCQDYTLVRDSASCTVFAVGDGAGGGQYNELGSALGLEILATHVTRLVEEDGVGAIDWRQVLDLYADDVEDIIRVKMGGGNEDVFLGIASQFFTHTVVLCVMDDETTQLVRFGDGYAGLNGYLISRDITYKDNMPPFPVYHLYRRLQLQRFSGLDWEDVYPDGLDFEVLAHVSTSEVRSFMLGTDGLRYVKRNAEQRLPGRKQLVGPIEQFMADARLAADPQALENRLNLIGRDHPLYEPGDPRKPEPGYLEDDVALIVGRRKESGDPHEAHGG